MHKARKADVFVFLDDVQFKRDSLQQRAKLAQKSATSWMSIPFVHAHPQLIRDVQFASGDWLAAHEEKVRAFYGHTLHYAQISPALDAFYSASYSKVADAVEASVRAIFELLRICPQIVRSSSLGAEGAKGDRVLDICKKLDATHYLTGKGGSSYLDIDRFNSAGVNVEVVEYSLPTYREWQPDPAGAGSGLSSLDAIAHLGIEKTVEIV